ncbi:unnamed protein product [Anisakis simplex]|uniref:Uncharacterized protein n=1 Tax=Anisakis simplex TaxID=6269 RepID=A0A3P6PKN0_ANISI|nr:unnamed protein product [Anisakis simplex]
MIELESFAESGAFGIWFWDYFYFYEEARDFRYA